MCIDRCADGGETGADYGSARPRFGANGLRVPRRSEPVWGCSQADLHSIIGDVPTGTLDGCALRRILDQNRVRIVDMNINLAADRARRKPLERAFFAAHRDVAHAPGGFLGHTQIYHLVVRESGAVEENERRPGEPLYDSFVDLGAARHVEKALGAVAQLDPDGRLAFGANRDVLAFEIERNFSWHRERRHPDAEAGVRGRIESNRMPIDEILVQNAKDPRARLRQGGLASKEREPLLLAKSQKPGEMIDLGIGDEDRPDRRMPLRAAWVQARRRDDLLAEIRRCVQKHPVLAIGADGET